MSCDGSLLLHEHNVLSLGAVRLQSLHCKVCRGDPLQILTDLVMSLQLIMLSILPSMLNVNAIQKEVSSNSAQAWTVTWSGCSVGRIVLPTLSRIARHSQAMQSARITSRVESAMSIGNFGLQSISFCGKCIVIPLHFPDNAQGCFGANRLRIFILHQSGRAACRSLAVPWLGRFQRFLASFQHCPKHDCMVNRKTSWL